ncbi:CHAT domain-containing protein [Aspergillus cavernicola]|uniref:CHAT domain-containing protein n=1 Tax=Aspergillus cavernicola TaxID=176166 RepID=A0ABR4INT2_9EURO
MDRAMSSYSLSIKTLLHGRRSTQVHGRGPSSTALLIDMGITNNQRALPFARDEIAMLEKLCSQIQLQPIHPAHKRKEDVLSILKTCTVFHFAGHGKSHGSDPSHSCLLLDDWQTTPLSVADLRDNWVEGHTAFLAYLSACSTGSNKDGSFADEAIHLVSGCQLAGFRHVVGTLWAVSDHHCVDVARTFYRTLQKEGLTDRAISKSEPKGTPDVAENHQTRFLRTATTTGLRATMMNPLGDPLAARRNRLPIDTWACQGSKTIGGIRESSRTFPRHERDATLCDSDEEDMPALSPLLWAPYFHTGV